MITEYLCGKCRKKNITSNLLKEIRCISCNTKNILSAKLKKEDEKPKEENPKVNVTIYETMSSGPTLDYLRENGMPDWIKDNDTILC